MTSDELTARIEAIRTAAREINTSQTETVTVADLAADDILISLGAVPFPFPFTLSRVEHLPTFGTLLFATHGWWTPQPRLATTPAVRVLRGATAAAPDQNSADAGADAEHPPDDLPGRASFCWDLIEPAPAAPPQGGA